MKKQMVCALALATAGAVFAAGEDKGGYPSIMRYFGQGLDSYDKKEGEVVKVDFNEGSSEAFGEAVAELYEKAAPIVAAVPESDSDLAYKFTMNLKVVENSRIKQKKATDFVEDYSDGDTDVYYFASAKRSIKGSIWVKPRPSVVLDALVSSFLGMEGGWGFGKAESSFGNLAGLLTEVRGVALWDAKKKAYLTPTLFGMGGAAMGKDGKEAFGGFLSVFGADFQKLAADAPDYLTKKTQVENAKVEDAKGEDAKGEDAKGEGGRYKFDWNEVCPYAGDYFGEDFGLAMGLGIGKNNFNKNGNYIKSLDGSCFYLSTKSVTAKPGLFFDAKGALPTDNARLDGKALVERLLSGMTENGPFGVFYNAYTAEPYPVPLDVTVGFGTWKLAANAGSIKNFAKCTTEAEKMAYFRNKTGLLKIKNGEPITLDMLKLVLDVVLLGDSGEKATAWFEGRKEQLDKYIAHVEKTSPEDKEDKKAMAETCKEFYDLLIKYCAVAKKLKVKDSSDKPLDVQEFSKKKPDQPAGDGLIKEADANFGELRTAIDQACAFLDAYNANPDPTKPAQPVIDDAKKLQSSLYELRDVAQNSLNCIKDEGIEVKEEQMAEWEACIKNAIDRIDALDDIIFAWVNKGRVELAKLEAAIKVAQEFLVSPTGVDDADKLFEPLNTDNAYTIRYMIPPEEVNQELIKGLENAIKTAGDLCVALTAYKLSQSTD